MSKRQRFMRLALLSLAAAASATVLYAAAWQGSWQVAAGKARVHSVELDLEHYGMAPMLYWLSSDQLLAVVPEALPPLEEAAATSTEEILVVDPETSRDHWRTLDGLALEDAASLQWSLEHHVTAQDGDAYLSLEPHGEGPVAQLSFSGLRFPLPVYNLNFPAFGEKGWWWETRYIGRFRLNVRPSSTAQASIELTRLLVNSAMFPDLYSLATWLPGGRFLVLSPLAYGERRLLLLGPLEPTSEVAPDRAEKDKRS